MPKKKVRKKTKKKPGPKPGKDYNPVKAKLKSTLPSAITSLVTLSIVIIAVSAYFVSRESLIGFAFVVLGLINIIFLKIHKIKLNQVYPDFVFGLIDNGVLVFGAVIGAHFAGIFGAIIGGAAGNTITDGIGGLFEGYVAQHQRKFEIDNLRTPMATMLGKMAGCLFGAGLGLIIVWVINLI